MATKQEILSKLAASHEQRISKVLFDLEEDIIAQLQRATDGVPLTTQLAIQLRPNLKTLIEQNYLKEGSKIISEYDEVVKSFMDFTRTIPDNLVSPKFKTLTKPDLVLINQLKQLSFSGFEDVANRFLDTIATEIYSSAVTGKPFPQVVENIRASINGVYRRSNEAAVNRLVAIVEENRYSDDPLAKKKYLDARKILHSKYASDIRGDNMRKYANQIAHDSIMQFDGQFTKHKGQEAGINTYKYTGTNITTTRQFCRANLNEIKSEEEWREVFTGNWRGKSGSDPFVNRGGYRCRHSLIPYDPAWDAIEEFNKIEPRPKTEAKPRSAVPDVAIASLLNKGSDKVRKAYQDEFNDQLTDQQKIIVNKLEKPETISKGKGVYRYRSGELVANSNAVSKMKGGDGVKSFVISHEYGHHIDYITSGKKNEFWSANNENFKKAIDKDRRRFKGENFKDLRTGKDDYYLIDRQELDKIFDDLAFKKDVFLTKKRYGSVFKYSARITELKDDGFASLSDIIDALTRGSFQKDYHMWGHGRSYYNRRGYIEMEIFANLFAIRHNEKAYNLAKKYIPNTVEEFEKRLLELERL
jgi:hypothetical protein